MNAAVELRREAALREAVAADEATARGDDTGPLHGVPMTIKDAFDVAGMHTTWGNSAFKDFVARSDSTVARRLKQAGAIVVGKTRAEIQRQALRLFRERGYEATTVARIAEEAEVSESTFFRYFPNKEDVVFWDELDPLVFEAFRGRPPELGPVRALRESVRGVLDRASAAEKADLRGRLELLLSVPPLRSMLLDGLRGPMRLLAEAMAERTERRPDDPAVRALAGAVMGVGLSAMFATAEDPDADVASLIDEGLKYLEAGFPT